MLAPYSVIDAFGRVLMSTMAPQQPHAEPGCTVVDELPPSEAHYRDLVADTWVLMPPRPSAAHVFDWPTHAWTDPRTLDELRAAQLASINAEGRRRAAALTAGYPDFEQRTWPGQEREALAWAADQAAPTPYLDGIAAARGIEPAQMRALTLAAVQAFQTASQQLVGTRQALRDAIQAAATREAVLAVAWPPLPEPSPSPSSE